MTELLTFDNSPRPVTLWRILVIFAVGALLINRAVYGIISFLMNSQRNAPAPARADLGASPGSFRPTKSQWDNFKIAPVQNLPFSAELMTDGNVSVSDAATTPMFSPYFGRVTRAIATLADSVAKGCPLMAVAFSEVPQRQNDLITVVAALNTFQSQVKLAEAEEKRQRQSYLV